MTTSPLPGLRRRKGSLSDHEIEQVDGAVVHLQPSRLVGRVRLGDRAIATSGNYEQHITVGDRRYGHLSDPRTGCPSEPVLNASVIARTSLEADALSTTAFLMGPEDGLRYVCESEQTEGLYVTEGEAGRVNFKATDAFPLDCMSDAA